jgi:hypothetical protein
VLPYLSLLRSTTVPFLIEYTCFARHFQDNTAGYLQNPELICDPDWDFFVENPDFCNIQSQSPHLRWYFAKSI